MNERPRSPWAYAYLEQTRSVRNRALGLSIMTCLAAVASVTLALNRLATIVEVGGRFDSSVGWTVAGLTFQWWLVVSLFVRLIGQSIGRLGWWLISLFALLCSLGLFIAWLCWSSRMIESVMDGKGITTSLLIGGNIFSDVVFVLVVLNLISEIALLIAATVKARNLRPGHRTLTESKAAKEKESGVGA